jgi:hypothetical protein
VVKAIGHWPWREAHHLNWWSILFTCRRRKLWSARCKCHCNMGNASPTCICASSVPHDWAPSGCCRHRGASYYYLSCLPQLHTKEKCPMLSNALLRLVIGIKHIYKASRSYYHHLRDKSTSHWIQWITRYHATPFTNISMHSSWEAGSQKVVHVISKIS